MFPCSSAGLSRDESAAVWAALRELVSTVEHTVRDVAATSAEAEAMADSAAALAAPLLSCCSLSAPLRLCVRPILLRIWHQAEEQRFRTGDEDGYVAGQVLPVAIPRVVDLSAAKAAA